MAELTLLSFPDHDDATSGCSTPPFHSSASVPFKWEEEPGKPIPCTAMIPFPEPISLELIPPPRMSWVDPKVTKNIVLDGISLSLVEESRAERGQLGTMVMMIMSDRERKSKKKVRRLFGSSWFWGGSRRGGEMGKRREGFGCSFVFPSSAATGFDDGRECYSEYGEHSECAGEQVKMSKIKKSKSFLSFTMVIPWKGSKLKKDEASTRGEHSSPV